jgi:uncharacterized membrane protein
MLPGRSFGSKRIGATQADRTRERGGEIMRSSTGLMKWFWVAAMVATAGFGWRAQAATEAAPQTLVYAVYDSETGAKQAFDALKQSQREGVIYIQNFAVVSKDQKGKVHVQSTQKRDAGAGAIIGALIGLLGGPAGAAAGAVAGGGIGFLTGDAVGIPRDKVDAIKASLTPGTSAIVAVIDERWAADLTDSLRKAQAKQVLDQRLATPDAQGSKPESK